MEEKQIFYSTAFLNFDMTKVIQTHKDELDMSSVSI